MSRLGTCKYSFEIQEMYRIPVSDQPHDRSERVVDPQQYTCQWLDTAGPLPPPVKRMQGGFCLRDTDCDECPRYQAAFPLSQSIVGGGDHD